MSGLDDFSADSVNAAVNAAMGTKNPVPASQTSSNDEFSSSAVHNAVTQAMGKPDTTSSAEAQQPSALGDMASKALSPTGEVALNNITGMGASILGGLSGISTLIKSGGDVDKAEQAIKDTQASLTYQPRSEEGQRGVEAESVPFDQASKGWTMLGKIAGGTAPSEASADTNEPNIGGTLGGLVVPVVGTLAGGKSLLDMAPEKVANPQDNLLPPQYGGTAQQPGLGSVGASASTTSQAAAGVWASPDLINEIKNAELMGRINPQAAVNQIRADTLPVRMQLTEGQATQDVNTLSNEMNNRAKSPDIAQRYNEQNNQLVQNLDAIRDSAAPDVFDSNHVESGRSLINAYNEHDAVLKADINAKYKALSDANGGSIPLDGQAFVANANQALAQQMKGAYLPKETQSIMNDIMTGKQPMTFENFENLRTNLATDARKFERQGDGNSAAAVSIVRNALEDMPLPPEAQQLKPLADSARSAARQRFQLLEQDPAYKAAVHGTVAPDDFINKFVINGKVDNVAAMKNNLGADPIATQTIANGVVNYLKSKAVGTAGNFSQAWCNKNLTAIEPKLNLLVDSNTAHDLSNLGEVARLTQSQPRGSYVNNSNTLTAALGKGAAGAGETALNVALPGLQVGSRIRQGIQSVMDKKAIKNTLKIGAGITSR